MYDTTIATKLIGQLEKFLGRISPRFHKPVARFIGDMMYGIMAEKDVKLSSVVRALKEGITPKKVEDRLSRMLSSKGLERGLHDAIAADGAGKVHQDTLVILDPSDVQKPHAKKMEHLAKVWDGSKGDVGDNLGYWGCMAVACESGGRRPVPLHFRLWSADSPGFVSENDEVEGIVKAISKHTKKREARHIRLRQGRGQHRVLPVPAVDGAGFHREAEGSLRQELEAHGHVRGARLGVPHAVPGGGVVRPPRGGKARDDRFRCDSRTSRTGCCTWSSSGASARSR